MICKATRVLLGVCVLSGLSYGGIVFVSSPAALDSNDSVLWSTLGADGDPIPNAFSVASVDGNSVGGGFSISTGQVNVAGTDWTPVSGDFSNGDFLIFADNGGNAGSGPITFTFQTGYGAGAAIQANTPGQFTAKIELFNGGTSLGFETVTSDVSGDAIFIGALDTIAEVTGARFSLTAAQVNSNTTNNLGDFALDTLSLQNLAVPEPGSILLMMGGLTATALLLRRRSSMSQKEKL
jgi:PEP-CTERM motif